MSIAFKPPAIRRGIPHRRYWPVSIAVPARSTPWYDGEPEACRRRAREFLSILAQLALLLAVFDVYRLETRSFRLIVLVALAALPAHYLAPYRWKKWVFVAISIVGMVLVAGLTTSCGVLALASALLGLAAAPFSWRLRVVLVAAVALVLAAFRPRVDFGAESLSAGLIPLVASMFMFRMIGYLYERKHAQRPEPLADVLSYFFLLPNCVFPHFPVVDYRTLNRGYFARDIHEIQRAGLAMISRGTVHLFAYRAIDRLLLVSPDAVHNAWTLAFHIVCNYLLYLRVSGQFHMVCGLLHLFGFQLPETHHRYLLASSFTDYWRRINIYWKDFMVRVVFNPVVFRLKRRSQPVALAAATAAVFVATWLLHAYQSFWLRGIWGFSLPDALFWGSLGVLVMINVQLEARRRPARPAGHDQAGARLIAGPLRALRIAGTFVTISVLWSLWSSPSLSSWIDMMRRGLGI